LTAEHLWQSQHQCLAIVGMLSSNETAEFEL